jgi:hypothetical protein
MTAFTKINVMPKDPKKASTGNKIMLGLNSAGGLIADADSD